MRDIGKNIRALRVNKKITQEELAELLCVTRQTVSNYENGRSRPDIDMVIRIAQVLDTDANAVLYGSPIPVDRFSLQKQLKQNVAILSALFLLLIILSPLTSAMRYERNLPAPNILIKLTLAPATMLMFGWTFLQTLEYFLHINIPKVRLLKYLGCFFIFVMLITILLSMPRILWLLVALIRQCIFTNVNTAFPYIPIYHELSSALLSLVYQYPYVFSILGIGIRMTFPSILIQHTFDPRATGK